MKYALEMGSGATIYIYIYISSFTKTGSAIQKLMGGIHRHTLISLLLIFKIRKVG
jgi:hypothetical protein